MTEIPDRNPELDNVTPDEKEFDFFNEDSSNLNSRQLQGSCWKMKTRDKKNLHPS